MHQIIYGRPFQAIDGLTHSRLSIPSLSHRISPKRNGASMANPGRQLVSCVMAMLQVEGVVIPQVWLKFCKYISKTKAFKKPQVMILSNMAPDMERVKRARVHAMRILNSIALICSDWYVPRGQFKRALSFNGCNSNPAPFLSRVVCLPVSLVFAW